MQRTKATKGNMSNEPARVAGYVGRVTCLLDLTANVVVRGNVDLRQNVRITENCMLFVDRLICLGAILKTFRRNVEQEKLMIKL